MEETIPSTSHLFGDGWAQDVASDTPVSLRVRLRKVIIGEGLHVFVIQTDLELEVVVFLNPLSKAIPLSRLRL